MAGHAVDASEASLQAYQRELLDGFHGLVARLDENHLSAPPTLAITRVGSTWLLRVVVQPLNRHISELILTAGAQQCILGFADGEILACHAHPGHYDGLVNQVMRLSERYLSGVTVLEHLNRRGSLVRKQYFYGIGPRGDQSLIGTSTFPLVFPKRVVKTDVYSCRLLRPHE